MKTNRFSFVIPEGNLRLLLHLPLACHSRRESAFRQPSHNVNRSPLCKTANTTSYVYILSNRSHILYIGVTNNLRKRVLEHRKQTPGTFTARYKVIRLVYFERYQYINNAIAREKELKHWTRAQKIALIESMNPTWEELMPDEPVPRPAPQTQIPFGNDN